MNYSPEKNNPSSVLVVDDHMMTREGLKKMLETTNDFRIVGQAKDGYECITKILNLKPDIAFVDLNIPKKNGIEVLENVKKKQPITKVILYSNFISPNHYAKALKYKVDGILLKECDWTETLTCLKNVIHGKQYISPFCKKLSIPVLQFNENLKNEEAKKLNKLTEKERLILKLISEQHTTIEISKTLFNSKKTIENVRYRICKKLEIFGPNSLTIFALKNKDLFV